MSRTNIAAQVPVGPYPAGGVVGALALDLAFTAADASNHNEFPYTGRDLLLMTNTDSMSHTVTFTSAPDEHGRTEDIATYALAAGVISIFNFRQGGAGWQQADGHVYFQASDATVKFAVLTLPN